MPAGRSPPWPGSAFRAGAAACSRRAALAKLQTALAYLPGYGITAYLTHARARTRRGREAFAEVNEWVSSPDRRRLFAFETIWLAGRRGRPLAVVVGSMLELGAESARLHAAAAAEIVALHPALVAAVGAFVPALEAHRAALGDRLVVAGDAEALGPALRAALRGDEVVLLKASRGVALERVLRFLN